MKIGLVSLVVGRPSDVDERLWELIEPLLPPWPEKAPGLRPVADRQCLQGILFVLHTGIGWEDLAGADNAIRAGQAACSYS